MRTYTAAELETKIRTEAGLTGSTAVTSAEILSLIDTYYSELYDLLVGAYGHEFYYSRLDYTTVAGKAAYDISLDPGGSGSTTDIYQILGVDLELETGEAIPIDPADFFKTRLLYASGTNTWPHSLYASRPVYRYQGKYLTITPAPSMSGKKIYVHYIPCAAKVTAGTAIIDGCNGWERYIVVACLASLAQAEETDPTPWMVELERIKKRIQALASKRVADGPVQIVRRRLRRTARWGYGLD